MFDRIAPTYDVLNKLMSFGIDKRWRAKAIALLGSGRPASGPVLDLCAGTLDLSAMLEEAFPGERIVACDFSADMLERGKDKVSRTERVVGDALALPVRGRVVRRRHLRVRHAEPRRPARAASARLAACSVPAARS